MSSERLDLIGYVRDDWTPFIRPAEPGRSWMDETPDAFAYRCLPLDHRQCPWLGDPQPVRLRGALERRPDRSMRSGSALDPGTDATASCPVSLFGHGVLTFHVEGLFRTPPGWNLWVGGPPNGRRTASPPLTGVIETDWSPFTFTMNWRFTRPGHAIRFDRGEPFCFFFPVERGAVERFDPSLVALRDAPEVEAQFEAWRESRLSFHEKMATDRPAAPSESWQKSYYRGANPEGTDGCPDHQQKVRPRPFREPYSFGRSDAISSGFTCVGIAARIASWRCCTAPRHSPWVMT